MYSHIERVKFISLDVDRYLFVQLFKRKKVKIIVAKDKICVVKLTQANEFIRFKNGDDYLDIKIVEVIINEDYWIKLGTIVDSSVPQRNIKN